MVKKYLTIAIASAFLAAAPVVQAPVQTLAPPSPIEISVIAEDVFGDRARKNNENLQSLIEEIKWMENDGIYQRVTLLYDKLKAPEYLTRKFIRSLGYAESEDYSRALSKMGARGWGQLMRAAWYEVDKSNYERNAFRLDKNMEVSIKYLKFLDSQLKLLYPDWNNLTSEEKTRLIAAAYNGGVKNLLDADWNVKSTADETRNYMKRIEDIAKEIAPNVKLFKDF